MTAIDPGIVDEVRKIADQKAVDFHKQKSLQSLVFRLQDYANHNSVLGFFPLAKEGYLELTTSLMSRNEIDATAEKIVEDLMERLEEAEEHWRALYVEPISVGRGYGAAPRELFHGLVLGAELRRGDSPAECVNNITERMLEFLRKGMKGNDHPSSIQGFKVYTNLAEYEDLRDRNLVNNSLSLEKVEMLVRDSMSWVLIALETIEQYHSRLVEAK